MFIDVIVVDVVVETHCWDPKDFMLLLLLRLVVVDIVIYVIVVDII